MSEWQPIETAPKDGSRIIVGGKSPDGIPEHDAVGQAYWRKAVKYPEYMQRSDEPADFYWASDNTRNGRCPWYISGWMPLPEPPADSTDEEER